MTVLVFNVINSVFVNINIFCKNILQNATFLSSHLRAKNVIIFNRA